MEVIVSEITPNKNNTFAKRFVGNVFLTVFSQPQDNFAHDLVRYDYITGQPMQGLVMTDENGDYQEAYEPASDPLLLRYLSLPNTKRSLLPHPLYRTIRRLFPFAPNLSSPEFIPTKTLNLFDTLNQYFPNHKLILSDFDRLPDSVPRHRNGPVVQIRYQGQMIACSTYLVQPGWFDIFFPTDFEQLKGVYLEVCGTRSDDMDKGGNGHKGHGDGSTKSVDRNAKTVEICSQKQFLSDHAQLDKTVTMSGENPMLSFYENFKFMLS